MFLKKRIYDILMLICHIILFICLVVLTIKAHSQTYKLLLGAFTVFHTVCMIQDIKKRLRT